MNQPAPAPAAKKPSHPPVPNFDTMKAMDALKKAGFDEPQAKGMVEFVHESQNRLATKEDLEKLRVATKADINQLRIELQGDMKTLEASLRGDMKTLEANLRTDMQNLFTRMLYYNLIAMGVATTIIGIVVSAAITLS